MNSVHATSRTRLGRLAHFGAAALGAAAFALAAPPPAQAGDRFPGSFHTRQRSGHPGVRHAQPGHHPGHHRINQHRRHHRHQVYNGHRHLGGHYARPHHVRRHRGHRGYSVYRAPVYYHTTRYYCAPCSHYFDSRRYLHDHVHGHHGVALIRLPFVIVHSALGWIFYG